MFLRKAVANFVFKGSSFGSLELGLGGFVANLGAAIMPGSQKFNLGFGWKGPYFGWFCTGKKGQTSSSCIQ